MNNVHQQAGWGASILVHTDYCDREHCALHTNMGAQTHIGKKKKKKIR